MEKVEDESKTQKEGEDASDDSFDKDVDAETLEQSELTKIYRTYEWRMKQSSESLIKNYFGFQDTIGEG